MTSNPLPRLINHSAVQRCLACARCGHRKSHPPLTRAAAVLVGANRLAFDPHPVADIHEHRPAHLCSRLALEPAH